MEKLAAQSGDPTDTVMESPRFARHSLFPGGACNTKYLFTHPARQPNSAMVKEKKKGVDTKKAKKVSFDAPHTRNTPLGSHRGVVVDFY